MGAYLTYNFKQFTNVFIYNIMVVGMNKNIASILL